MSSTTEPLKQLLGGTLPLENVGPHLRRAVRRALLSGDPDRLASAGRAAVAELLRRGDLVRVAVEGDGSDGPVYCMRRDTRDLVDLSPLGGAAPPPAWSAPPPAPPVPEAPSGHPEPGALDTVTGVLGAMEEAQNLDVGDPRSGEAGVILAGILRLLGRFTPQFRLSIMLHESVPLPEEPGRLFVADEEERAHGWLGLRRPGAAVWIPDPSSLPRRVRALAAERGESLAVAAAVPVLVPDEPGRPDGDREVGLLFVAAPEVWERELLLRLSARLSAFVTRRWQQQQQVNRRIHTDSLTGVHNRAFFDSQFTLELERARRSNVPLTLVIADLDHFKAINDGLGHLVGDRVLKAVARRLQDELRRIDHVCRIGGEEFALVLPDTSHEAACDVMRRLLAARLGTEIVRDGVEERVGVTFSYGAATFPDAGVDAFELYRKADAMLYLSKDAGRNRCHFWNSNGDHLQLLPPGA